MVVVDVLVGVLLAALALVTAAALWVGVLGALGGLRFVRCDRCDHLGVTSSREPLKACVHCKHGQLVHPLAALHHGHLPHPLHARRRVHSSH